MHCFLEYKDTPGSAALIGQVYTVNNSEMQMMLVREVMLPGGFR